MKRESSNIAASIQAKLQNKAHESGRPFNEILQYYGMERFLYRLSKTPHVNDLILKGGLMFYSLGIPMRRTTRDIDFLGISENAQRDILSIFRDALSVPFPEDGVLFDAKTLRFSQTQVEANQGGIGITFVGNLGKMRLPIQADVGFSDELASDVLSMDYPVLLTGMERPRIKGYPPESIISEKFYAMVRFADTNSRWKDYYDIYLLTDTFEFESQSVANAIRSTFGNRPAELKDQIPYGLRESFAIAKQKDWALFLRKSKLENKSIENLAMIVNRIWRFLAYPLSEIQTGEKLPRKRWLRSGGWR
ncbi:MAG: nucleotidyl transferase AbiEii/AbiGii toxin family protein [Chloroflexi bacterium]|nr:nucleotidyl transferase AbiEii/AbiGii toxin family protein [Chloroflexota bacterium]